MSIYTLLHYIKMWKSPLFMALFILAKLVVPAEVLALRPFVTTDADVVKPIRSK